MHTKEIESNILQEKTQEQNLPEIRTSNRKRKPASICSSGNFLFFGEENRGLQKRLKTDDGYVNPKSLTEESQVDDQGVEFRNEQIRLEVANALAWFVFEQEKLVGGQSESFQLFRELTVKINQDPTLNGWEKYIYINIFTNFTSQYYLSQLAVNRSVRDLVSQLDDPIWGSISDVLDKATGRKPKFDRLVTLLAGYCWDTVEATMQATMEQSDAAVPMFISTYKNNQPSKTPEFFSKLSDPLVDRNDSIPVSTSRYFDLGYNI